jgi:uncharacterized membrane protein YdjX (TVP38/TMEM64 family)
VWAVVVGLVCAVITIGFLVGRAVTLADAQRWIGAARAAAAATPPVWFALLFAAHLLTMAFSLPLKALLTVVAGALLGTVAGAAVTVLGVLAGTSALFWAVRRGLGSRWQRAAGEWLRRLDRRVARRPVRAVAALRLAVTLPYGPITIAAALTTIRYRDFLLGSLLGDLPVIALYAAAGRELGRLESLSDVLSPGTLLVLLAAAAAVLASALFGGRERGARAAAAGASGGPPAPGPELAASGARASGEPADSACDRRSV